MPRVAQSWSKPRSAEEEKAFKYWLENPVEAVKDWFGVTPEDYQGDWLNGVFGNKDRSATKSAHGVGKTTTLSWAGWIFLNCYQDSRLVATAPTLSQLEDALWPEYAKWHDKMPEGMAQQWEISGKHIRNKAKPKLWFAVARTSNKPANLQGFHGTHIMIQADEASAVPPDVFEVIEGALSEAGEDGKVAKLMMAGNPNFTAGEFYDAFSKNKELYSRITVSGDVTTLDALGVSNGDEHKDHGRIYVSKRVSQKYRDNMSRKYGPDSAVYDVRVRGVFPRQDDRAVVPLEWAERAQGKAVDQGDMVRDGYTIVLDVARFGGDETVLGLFRSGVPAAPLKTWPKTSTVQCVNIVKEAKLGIEGRGLRVDRIVIDEPGVGGGVIDQLRADGIAVTPYNGGESLKQGVDPADDIRMFANRRSRDWWIVRRRLELELLPLPDDDVLVAQLASVQYDYNSKQKIQVESKKDMRTRLGEDASPDRGDVIVMGMAPWYSMAATNTMISPHEVMEGSNREWADEIDQTLW